MNITNSAGVQAASAATAATEGSTAGDAQLLVLKKALAAQSASAMTLLQSLPPSTPLATSGTLGRHVNTHA